jgi:hypothetical protein
MIWTGKFWQGTAERAIKTFAQTLAAAFVIGVPVFELDLGDGLAIAATATLFSVFTSIGNAEFTAGGGNDSGV